MSTGGSDQDKKHDCVIVASGSMLTRRTGVSNLTETQKKGGGEG